MTDRLRLVFLSDTHGFHDLEVPPGDVLVHAGDGCKRGSLEEAAAWGAFVASLPHARKIVIAGNHDRCFEHDLDEARRSFPASIDFLHDSGCTVEGVRVWGSPWQPWFLSWAFNLQRGPEIAAKWALIPDATDVLITRETFSATTRSIERRNPGIATFISTASTTATNAPTPTAGASKDPCPIPPAIAAVASRSAANRW